MRFSIFQDSRLGDRRENQDRVGYAYDRERLIMVVADGMGGHYHGEIAAQIAVAEILRLFERDASASPPADFLVALLLSAHRAIGDHAKAFELRECPRTTCVACLVQGGRVWWVHAGDSRLYLLRGGTLLAETRDHTRVRQLLDAGVITAEMAAIHPDRHRVYSGLGGDQRPTIDVGGDIALESGDTLLLSSDGFWSQHEPNDIARQLRSKPIAALLPPLLTEAQLLARGGSDNLSVVALTWDPPPGMPTAPPAPPEGFHLMGSTTFPGGPGRTFAQADAEFARAIAELRASRQSHERQGSP